jgi:hypothetical protein
MDNIERLLKEINDDPSLWKDRIDKPIRFSGKFLDTVGEIFEKYGFGSTKVYLMNQSGRDRMQASAMLKVLERFGSYPEVITNRAIGRYIIKTLETLKKMGV